jgi:hypothetical protein
VRKRGQNNELFSFGLRQGSFDVDALDFQHDADVVGAAV